MDPQNCSSTIPSLFDRLRWRDPLTGVPLEPLVAARTPAGVPVCGSLRIMGTNTGYPIVDCVARVTPELAVRYHEWLALWGLKPPRDRSDFQEESTVDSFGFQWSFDADPRTESDLGWRVANRFGLDPAAFSGKLVLDAGSGAGDQSRWLLEHGAEVLSVDLSSAIDVVAQKLRMRPGWFGVQGDVTALPLEADQFDFVYCEGVIQHTRDSPLAVRQLVKAVTPGGFVLATHYAVSNRLLVRARAAYTAFLRGRLSGLDRYWLLLVTGVLAALSYVPFLGYLLRQSGTAVRNPRMPDFKSSWSATFDAYGTHAYQRRVSSRDFWDYFHQAGDVEAVRLDGTLVVARRLR